MIAIVDGKWLAIAATMESGHLVGPGIVPLVAALGRFGAQSFDLVVGEMMLEGCRITDPNHEKVRLIWLREYKR